MIRLLRLLEYTYDNVESMEKDMQRWQIGANALYAAGSHLKIRSATLPLQTLTDETPKPTETQRPKRVKVT